MEIWIDIIDSTQKLNIIIYYPTLDDDYENYDCANKKCGEHCIKDWDIIGYCNINGECKTFERDLGCEGSN